MYSLIPFCVSALFLVKGVYAQQCEDCINYDRCPAALALALPRISKTNETMQKLKNAHCGFDRSGAQLVPKVCCSLFSVAPRGGFINDNTTSEDNRIANHPNLNLLSGGCGRIQGNRIVGGTNADLYEFPWMALVAHSTQNGNQFMCGGSIINKRYVLTAAHCVKDKDVVGVRVGEYDISEINDCQKGRCESHIQDLPINRTIIHKNYHGRPTVTNDIALLRLQTDIDFEHRNVDPICLPITSENRNITLSGQNATVTGWGITENLRSSNILRKVEIPIFPAERCSEIYNRFSRPGDADVTTNQLCAGSENKKSCEGDSGGPLALKQLYNKRPRFIQYGIDSYGPRQCASGVPGVYTDVTKYMGWILDNISP